MNMLQRIRDQITFGEPIINKLFSLNDNEIKKVLKKLVNDTPINKKRGNIPIDKKLWDSPVIRTFKYQTNNTIELCNGSKLVVNMAGVVYKSDNIYEDHVEIIYFGDNSRTLTFITELGAWP